MRQRRLDRLSHGEPEGKGFVDFWRVYRARALEVGRAVGEAFQDDEGFLAIYERDLGVVQRDTDALVALGLGGDWGPYEVHLRSLAARYVASGISFEKWHLLARVIGEVVTVHVIEEHRQDPGRLRAALVAMRIFLDEVVSLVASEFMSRKEAAVVQSREELRALTARLHTLIEDERIRIAREAHDELGQQLTALKLDLAWVRRLDGRDPEQAAERIDAMVRLVDATIESVRRIATRLRPRVLDDLGLAAALECEARDFEARAGVPVALALPSDHLDLTREQATALFRISQELLTNVARHARARSVSVTLDARGEQVVLEVQDDGRGLPAPADRTGPSLGLVGARERASLLGGTLDVRQPDEGGTLVRTWIPRSATGGAAR